MLTLSGLTLLAGIWLSPNCPTSFQITNTTVGAISKSSELLVCVRNSTLIRGEDGNLKLVLNASKLGPTCLVYPNGLSPDLSFDLLSKGYRGCWSLYPPSQPIAIVNIGKPDRQQISSALKTFRPTQPRILVKPNQGLLVGDVLNFSQTAKMQVIKTKLLDLPCQVRFTPRSYAWLIGQTRFRTAQLRYVAKEPGSLSASLTVSYGIEYRFAGLTSWSTVRPGLISNAPTIRLNIGVIPIEPPNRKVPRLVDKPCGLTPRWGC